jgi:amino acid transporter/nucleotide-binding universal stress UspA family protein
MIGAGIFVLPSIAADSAGPAAALSFFIGGVIALLTAMTASELGTAMPKAGGSYYFVNHALGPIFGSVVGWGNWMGLAFASAFYCIGFGDYVIQWLPVATDTAISLGVMSLSVEQIAALAAATLFVGVNYMGAKETGNIQNVIVITLLVILGIFMAGAMLQGDVAKLKPFAPKGYGSVLPTTALVFVSFLGFAKITTVAEEIRNPGRNLPLAIIGSVLAVTVIYVVVMLVLTSATPTPLDELEGVAVVEVGRIALGSFGAVMLTFGGLLATASSANASILASSRINFAMGRDKLVSDWLNKIHDKFATPSRSIAVTGGIILAFILYGDVKTLAKAGSVLHLIVYGCMNLALLVMREADDPNYNPDYEVPYYPLIPIAGAISSFGLIAFMGGTEQLLSLAFVGVGILWYFVYAKRQTEKRGLLTSLVVDRSEQMPDSAVEAAKMVRPNTNEFRVMVPLANPETEKNLMTLASAYAKQHGGTVVAVHIVQVPEQTPLEMVADDPEYFDGSEDLLEKARQDAETFGVDVETHTILSHRSFDEIFDAARTHDVDLTILGWGEDAHGSPGRVESAMDDLTGALPCDFIVYRDRGLEPSNILLPTAGGPASEISAEVARVLSNQFDTEMTLMHVVDDERERAQGEAFLDQWAREHGFGDAEQSIAISEDPYAAIEAVGEDYSLVILGASERGLLQRLVDRHGLAWMVEQLGVSVILAEPTRPRSLWERLFGPASR